MHCVAGVSRSAAICLAYLTKFHCKSLRAAYHLMATKRKMVRPNLGFWRQLIDFEQVTKFNFIILYFNLKFFFIVNKRKFWISSHYKR